MICPRSLQHVETRNYNLRKNQIYDNNRKKGKLGLNDTTLWLDSFLLDKLHCIDSK